VPEPDSPGGTPGDAGTGMLRPGEQLILRGIVLNDGRNTVTLFTDPRRAIQTFGKDTPVLGMQGRKLLEMLTDAVILLNPADGRGRMMEPDQIKALLAHAPIGIARSRPPGPVELSESPGPRQPVALIGRLNELFRELTVDEAWLARARWTEAGQIGWFLDIRSDGPADEIIALCERAVRGLAFGGEVFDVSVSKPGGEKGVGVKVG
jgi:hypothetical protein